MYQPSSKKKSYLGRREAYFVEYMFIVETPVKYELGAVFLPQKLQERGCV